MANNPKNVDANIDRDQEGPFQKDLICESVYGKVKWFNVKRGYGFVCRNDNQEDVFIHQSAIVKSNPEHPRRSVGEGEEIKFDIVKGTKGNEAANVCGADGEHVKGSEYALRYLRGSRGRFRGGRGRGRGRSRGPSEDNDNLPQEMGRGGPPRGGGGGRFIRGGRPYVAQFRRPFPNYEMPPIPPYHYDYDYFREPPRGRGGFRGYRIYRGGPPRDMAMNFEPYDDYDYDYNRPPPPPPFRGGGGRGRPRFRARGRSWRGRGGPRDNGRGNVKDMGEELHDEAQRE